MGSIINIANLPHLPHHLLLIEKRIETELLAIPTRPTLFHVELLVPLLNESVSEFDQFRLKGRFVDFWRGSIGNVLIVVLIILPLTLNF